MKYLGIDFGAKRVGLSISDEDGIMAFPWEVLSNNHGLIEKIMILAKKENIEKIVLGESRNFLNQPNEIMKAIEIFKKEIEEKSGIEVIFEPEFWTSFQAKRFQGENEMHDASSAAIILQSYLDKLRS